MAERKCITSLEEVYQARVLAREIETDWRNALMEGRAKARRAIVDAAVSEIVRWAKYHGTEDEDSLSLLRFIIGDVILATEDALALRIP